MLLVEDHPIISESLAVALRLEGHDVDVAGAAATLTIEGVLDQAAARPPDIVILDLQLGAVLSIPVIRPLTAAGARVVVLTGVTDEAVLGQCLVEGAIGVLSKEAGFDHLRQAVLDAAAGQAVVSERRRVDLLDAAAAAARAEQDRLAPFRTLTKRESVVLAHLVSARSADEIAKVEYVSLTTVRSQIQSVLRKLGVSSQLAAVALANERGWRLDGGEGSC